MKEMMQSFGYEEIQEIFIVSEGGRAIFAQGLVIG